MNPAVDLEKRCCGELGEPEKSRYGELEALKSRSAKLEDCSSAKLEDPRSAKLEEPRIRCGELRHAQKSRCEQLGQSHTSAAVFSRYWLRYSPGRWQGRRCSALLHCLPLVSILKAESKATDVRARPGS